MPDDDGARPAQRVHRGREIGRAGASVVRTVGAIGVAVPALVEGEDRQAREPGRDEVPEPALRREPVQQDDRGAAARPAGRGEAYTVAGEREVDAAGGRRCGA
ncbi:MAG: hypothetical protein JO079_01355 [Frankiaceae bacterium]|nr:hypothetical protein [Frankiaceae bacterium]